MKFTSLTAAELHVAISALQVEYADLLDDDRLEDWLSHCHSYRQSLGHYRNKAAQ